MKKERRAEFAKWMGPLLDALRELGDSATPQEASDLIARICGISDHKKEELMESGSPRFHNQVCWARQYLVWEGLVSSSKRGIWTLTEKGRRTTLSEEDSRQIFLKWVDIHRENRKKKESQTTDHATEAAPEE